MSWHEIKNNNIESLNGILFILLLTVEKNGACQDNANDMDTKWWQF